MPFPSFVTAIRGRLPATAPSGGGPSIAPGKTQLPPPPAKAYQQKAVAAPIPTSKQSGRNAAGAPSTANATSNTVRFVDTASAGSDKTYSLQAAGDMVDLTLTSTVTATGNTSTVDILNAYSQINILAPDIGVIIRMSNGVLTNGGGNTMPDIYMLSQRFSEFGQLPATVNVTGATAVSATHYIAGISLPAAQGPYQVEVVLNSTAGFSASTTALSVTYGFAFGVGQATSGRLRYFRTLLPSQPTDSGEQDYGPNASKQGTPLAEFFWCGLIGASDIATLQASSGGHPICFNTPGSVLAALSNAQMTAALPTGVLYPCQALRTSVTLGVASTWLVTFAAAPATSGVSAGYAWFD